MQRHRSALPICLLLASVTLVAPASAWTTGQHFGATNVAGFAAIDAYVQAQMQAGQIPGAALAIVQGDKVVHMQGFGVADPSGRSVTPQTPFIIGSVGKTFTGLAIRQLVNAGKVELDAPAQRYVPWFHVADPQASARITVRNLVEHKSGIPISAGEQAYQMEERYTTEQLVRMAGTVQLDRPVGGTFEYSNINFLVLGLIVEAASGQSFTKYVQQHIIAPLGMQHTHLSEADALPDGLAAGYRTLFGFRVPARVPFPSGMLPSGYGISTAEDLGNYLVAYLNHGDFNGASITDPAGQAAGRDRNSYYYGVYWDQKPCPCQGVSEGQSGGTLNYNAYLNLRPDQRWGVAILMNTRTMLDDFLPVVTAASIGQGVMAQLEGRPAPASAAPAYWQWNLIIDAILLLLVVFAVGQVARFGHWRRAIRSASVWTWLGTIAIGLLSLALGLLFVAGVPILFSTNWEYMLASMPDISAVLLGSGLVLIAITLAKITAIAWSRLPRRQRADTTNNH